MRRLIGILINLCIDNIYKDTSTSIKFEILESICKELDCSPDDILTSEDPKMQFLLNQIKP